MKKTQEKRQEEIDNILLKLNELGISDNYDGINKFKEMCYDYIKTGQSYSGYIKIKDINYKLNYLFSNQNNIQNYISIKKLNN